MPVLLKDEHKKLRRELSARISALMGAFESRELKNNREGCKGRGHWVDPDARCATIADEIELRMAVEDFKNILAEIKRLK